MSDLNTLSNLSKSLPEQFSFYGFGEVLKSAHSGADLSRLPALLEGMAGVSFKLLGNPAALLIVLFDEKLDLSMYTELGNIIASKLSQSLSEQGEGDQMITPPLALKSEQLARLAKIPIPFIHKTYEHIDQGNKVLVETLILPVAAEGQVGHA